MAFAASSICGVIRSVRCAGAEALGEAVPESRSQAAMHTAVTRTNEMRLIDDM
jgi:hypothetical protein